MKAEAPPAASAGRARQRSAIRRWLRDLLDAAQWRPGPVGFLTNPYHFARSALWTAIADLAAQLPPGRVLDVGCGCSPYRSLIPASSYARLEFDTPENRAAKAADLWYDGSRFPVPDRSFDLVLCSQVLEHVFAPQAFMAEISRVLAQDGRLLLSVPFVWDEHEQPFDFGRYTSFGLAHLCRDSGLEIEQHRTTLADARLLVQLAGAQAARPIARLRQPALRLAAASLWCLPAHLAGLLAGRILPWNRGLYLDHVILARRTASTRDAP